MDKNWFSQELKRRYHDLRAHLGKWFMRNDRNETITGTFTIDTDAGYGITLDQASTSGAYGYSSLRAKPTTEDTNYPGFLVLLDSPDTNESDRFSGFRLRDGDGSNLFNVAAIPGLSSNVYFDLSGGGDLLVRDSSGNNIAYFDQDGALVIADVGGLLGTPVAGAFEFDNDRMYVTNVGVHRAIDRTSDVITSTTTVSNTTTETTIYTGTLGANDLKAANHIEVMASGVISNDSASDDITINVYIGSTQVVSFNPAIGNVTNADWHLEFEITVRSVGGSGSIAFHGHTDINGNEDVSNSIETIDTTAAQNLTIQVQWDNAKAGNTISIYQGVMHWSN